MEAFESALVRATLSMTVPTKTQVSRCDFPGMKAGAFNIKFMSPPTFPFLLLLAAMHVLSLIYELCHCIAIIAFVSYTVFLNIRLKEDSFSAGQATWSIKSLETLADYEHHRDPPKHKPLQET